MTRRESISGWQPTSRRRTGRPARAGARQHFNYTALPHAVYAIQARNGPRVPSRGLVESGGAVPGVSEVEDLLECPDIAARAMSLELDNPCAESRPPMDKALRSPCRELRDEIPRGCAHGTAVRRAYAQVALCPRLIQRDRAHHLDPSLGIY